MSKPSPTANVVRLLPRGSSHELKERAKAIHREAVAKLTPSRKSREAFFRTLVHVSELEDKAREAAEWERAEIERMQARDEIRQGAEVILSLADRRKRARLIETALEQREGGES